MFSHIRTTIGMIRFRWLLWCVIVVYIWMCLLGQLISPLIRSLFSGQMRNGKNCRVFALSFALQHSIWTSFWGRSLHHYWIHTHTYISHFFILFPFDTCHLPFFSTLTYDIIHIINIYPHTHKPRNIHRKYPLNHRPIWTHTRASAHLPHTYMTYTHSTCFLNQKLRKPILLLNSIDA